MIVNFSFDIGAKVRVKPRTGAGAIAPHGFSGKVIAATVDKDGVVYDVQDSSGFTTYLDAEELELDN